MEQIFKLLLTIMGASLIWMYGMKNLAQPRRLQTHSHELEARQRTLPHLFGGLAKSPLGWHYLRLVAFYMIFLLVLVSIAAVLTVALYL